MHAQDLLYLAIGIAMFAIVLALVRERPAADAARGAGPRKRGRP